MATLNLFIIGSIILALSILSEVDASDRQKASEEPLKECYHLQKAP